MYIIFLIHMIGDVYKRQSQLSALKKKFSSLDQMIDTGNSIVDGILNSVSYTHLVYLHLHNASVSAYSFKKSRIYSIMVSECSAKKYDGINAGFFTGIGRHGRIVQV